MPHPQEELRSKWSERMYQRMKENEVFDLEKDVCDWWLQKFAEREYAHAIELAAVKSNHDQLKTYYEGLMAEREQAVRSAVNIISNYPHRVFDLYNGKLPWVVFQGEASEDEKKLIYETAFRDCVALFKKSLALKQ